MEKVKDAVIVVRVTKAEKDNLRKAADKEGFTVAQLIRYYMRKVLR